MTRRSLKPLDRAEGATGDAGIAVRAVGAREPVGSRGTTNGAPAPALAAPPGPPRRPPTGVSTFSSAALSPREEFVRPMEVRVRRADISASRAAQLGWHAQGVDRVGACVPVCHARASLREVRSYHIRSVVIVRTQPTHYTSLQALSTALLAPTTLGLYRPTRQITLLGRSQLQAAPHEATNIEMLKLPLHWNIAHHAASTAYTLAQLTSCCM